MRLLTSSAFDTFELIAFDEDVPPPFAILSHTWIHNEEVTYDELVIGTGKEKAGYAKLQFCHSRAAKDSLEYFWVDTCCIDRRNNTELSQAINSMFYWYQSAAKCYVYLLDVEVLESVVDMELFRTTVEESLRRSRWFTRGWTLQELIAPAIVEFFSRNSIRLDSKKSLEDEIHAIMGLPIGAIRGCRLNEYSVDRRIEWVSDRSTTMGEDKAYYLLEIFATFMPLIYSEEEYNAFQRLQEAIE